MEEKGKRKGGRGEGREGGGEGREKGREGKEGEENQRNKEGREINSFQGPPPTSLQFLTHLPAAVNRITSPKSFISSSATCPLSSPSETPISLILNLFTRSCGSLRVTMDFLLFSLCVPQFGYVLLISSSVCLSCFLLYLVSCYLLSYIIRVCSKISFPPFFVDSTSLVKVSVLFLPHP